MSKNNDKKISKNIIEKHSQKLRDHTKQSATDAFKAASKRIIKKTAETTGILVGKKNCL